MFKKLYRDLDAGAAAARAPRSTAMRGFAWNTTALDELPDWPEQRYLDYLAAIDTQEKAKRRRRRVNRVGYSPGRDGASARRATRSSTRAASQRRPIRSRRADARRRDRSRRPSASRSTTCELAACSGRTSPATAHGDGDARGDGDVDLYVRRGAAPTPTTYDCKSAGDASDETCTVDGGGPVYVAVFGAEAEHASTSHVAYTTADVADPTCLDGEMPRDAVLVKADWQRELTARTLPIVRHVARRA